MSQPINPLNPRQEDAELKKRDEHFREVLLPRLTPLLSILAIIVSLFAIFGDGTQGFREIYDLLIKHLDYIIIGSNILVSFIASVFLVRQRNFQLEMKNAEKFRRLAELGDEVDIKLYTSNINNRVVKLLSQFRLHVSLFAVSLVLIYTIIGLTKYTEHEDRVISYFTVSTNLLNLIGALFVHCAFSVLYNKTLIAESTSSRETARDAVQQFRLETTTSIHYYANQYWAMPLLIVVPYTLIFITLSVANVGIHKDDQATFLNIADLFAGSYNGLAMSLLFGRFVSIEQAVRNTRLYSNFYKYIFDPFSTVSYHSLVTIGIVFILPIYALAQPLFGSLQFKEFGDPKVFQMWVFGICLLGKICLFHLTYLLIGKRILYLYIYGLTTNVGNFRELEACFLEDEQRNGSAPADKS